MTRLYCDGPTLIRAVASAIANLEAHVEEVDALNVFPVPDGDTGSNMLATMRAALAEAEQLPAEARDLHAVAEALSRGALRGARGNSGVILSQIIRGMTSGAEGRRRASGLDFAAGLRRGSEVAYGSVLTPVEGTILTVVRDAAEAAESAAGRQPHVEAVLAATIEAAASSVLRTPTLLPILEDAGVVDSGGQGLYRLLEGTLQLDSSVAVDPALMPPARRQAAASGARSRGVRAGPAEALAVTSPQGDGSGYETEYLLSSPEGRLVPEAIRSALQELGDSVIVAGDERVVRVHIHGPRPDLALGIGLSWGRLGSVSVRDLDEQVSSVRVHGHGHAHRPGSEVQVPAPAAAAASRTSPADVALVAVTAAPGFARLFTGLGARVVRPGHGSRPSVGEIVEGILASGATAVIVLPNDRDAMLAAGQADELTPLVSVRIVPTRNPAEGVAAALAFDPTASLADNLAVMEDEASSLRTFSVARAMRDAVIDGVAVRAGQLLALDPSRRLLACESTIEAAVAGAIARFDDFELVTCYHGDSFDPETAERLRTSILKGGIGAEVELIEGGQRDDLLVALE